MINNCIRIFFEIYAFLRDFIDCFFWQAIELDDTDVYIVNELGKIALNTKQLDVAQMAFEKVCSIHTNRYVMHLFVM